jgi:hypothetical protein
VARRAAPAVLVVSGALANLLGRPGLAALLLLVAVPACACGALADLGRLLDGRETRLQVALAALATPLVVLASATRGSALATTALVLCLGATGLQAVVGAGSEVALERQGRRRVAREVDQRLDEDERGDGGGGAEDHRRAQQPLRRRRAA